MLVEDTKDAILGYKLVLAEDFSARAGIEKSVMEEIEQYELLEGDEDAEESIKLYKQFLVDCQRHAKKLSKLELKESIYEDALKSAKDSQRDFIIGKLQEIAKEKHFS